MKQLKSSYELVGDVRAGAVAWLRAWGARVRAGGLGDDERWRYVAQVAEWGLDYYRGEQAAVDGVERSLTPRADDDTNRCS